MQIHWTSKSIPEFSGVPRRDRRRLWLRYVWPSFTRWQPWGALGLAVALGFAGNAAGHGLVEGSWLAPTVGGAVGAGFGGFFFGQVLIAVTRPHLAHARRLGWPMTVADSVLQQKLDAIFGAHMDAELSGDLDQTLATMSPDPHLVNVPTMVGAQGSDGVRTFYANRLIGQFFPPDVTFETISRTYSAERLVDELIISFTHTTTIDWMLPCVEPTGKRVEAVFVVIVGFEGDKVSYEHIHWDQANVLVQIGLLDPTGLPVTGAGAASKLRNPALPDPFFGEG